MLRLGDYIGSENYRRVVQIKCFRDIRDRRFIVNVDDLHQR